MAWTVRDSCALYMKYERHYIQENYIDPNVMLWRNTQSGENYMIAQCITYVCMNVCVCVFVCVCVCMYVRVGRNGVVGIVTCYGLYGPKLESQWEQIFRARPDRSRSPSSLLYNGYRVSFLGVKRPRRGVDHPFPSSAEVNERVQLYLYSPSGPSWSYRVKFTFRAGVHAPTKSVSVPPTISVVLIFHVTLWPGSTRGRHDNVIGTTTDMSAWCRRPPR
jgi:hypothetical protein